MTEDVLEHFQEGVTTLTLNRPDRLNAFTAEMLAQLRDTLYRIDADRTVGAVILTGAGRGFCAGGDVKRMNGGAIDHNAADAEAVLRGKMELAYQLHALSKPVIAMVNGPAAGAGLSLALACDLRIAGSSARFTTAFARVGLPGDFGGSFFLSQLVGPARARELYFTSETLDAGRALALGLVNRVVPDADLHAEANALARQLAGGPTLAFAQMKRNLNAAQGDTLAAVLDMEARHQVAASRTADHREAAQAFVEKRAPVFRGR
ncbi:MAG: enoyl-CoA hydratase [Pseudomonadota bacterium]